MGGRGSTMADRTTARASAGLARCVGDFPDPNSDRPDVRSPGEQAMARTAPGRSPTCTSALAHTAKGHRGSSSPDTSTEESSLPFINDLAERFAWAVPAPIGYVEPGWAAIASDLLQRIDVLVTAAPGATLDILDVSARSGALSFTFALDGVGRGGPALEDAIRSAVAAAESRSRVTCPYSGRHSPEPHAARRMSATRGAPQHAGAAPR